MLAHSPAAFDTLTGGVVPEWRAGVAIPALNMLVVPALYLRFGELRELQTANEAAVLG